MNLPNGYVDGFGLTYSAGIVVPTDINIISQNNRFLRYGDGSYSVAQNSQSCHISFRGLVFVNIEAKDAGKRPLNFVASNGAEYFTFECPFAEAPKTDEELISKCEEYLSQIVIGQ